MTGDADAGGVECELEPIAGAEAEAVGVEVGAGSGFLLSGAEVGAGVCGGLGLALGVPGGRGSALVVFTSISARGMAGFAGLHHRSE